MRITHSMFFAGALGSATLACGNAPEPDAEVHSCSSHELLGDYRPNHRRNCADWYKPVIADMVFAMRVTAPTFDYEEELLEELRVEGYWPMNRDPFARAHSRVQYEKALLVSRSVNDLKVRCRDRVSGGHGRTLQKKDHGSYFTQRLKLDDDGGAVFEDDPWAFRARMGTIFHEVMHTHGYRHKRHSHDQYNHSMPQITRHALQDALARTPDPTPSRTLDCESPPCETVDTMREYRELGYLVFSDGLPRFDPGRRGLGVLHQVERAARSRLELRDAQLHGQRYRRQSTLPFDASFESSADDVIEYAGALIPGTTGGELLVRDGAGLAAVAWRPVDPSDFKVVRRALWGDSLEPHGLSRWTVSSEDEVVGVTDVRTIPPVTHVPPGFPRSSPEVLLRGSTGLAFTSVLFGRTSLSVRAVLSHGDQVIRGSLAWTMSADARVLAVGDFTGDGLDDDVLLADRSNLVILRHSGDGPEDVGDIQLVALNGASVGGWSHGPTATVEAVGDFDADGRDEWLARNDDGIAVFELNATDGGIELVTQVDFGEALASAGSDPIPFTISADDQILAGRITSESRDDLVMFGEGGLAAVFLSGRLRVSPFTRLLPADSNPSELQPGWLPRRLHRGMALELLTDSDGDGLDELYFRSNRWVGVIEWTESVTEVRLAVTEHTLKKHGCQNESCHNSLWGNWLVRTSDALVGAFPGDGSGSLVVVQNQGE